MLDTDLCVHCPFHYVSQYFHAIQKLRILRCITCNIPSLGSVMDLRIPVIQSKLEYVRSSVVWHKLW